MRHTGNRIGGSNPSLSATLIPRIVDFVAHGQMWLAALFIAGYFCYALQVISVFVYVGGLVYPLLQALARCSESSPLLACADPVFSEYAAASWLIIGLAAILVILAPYLGAYFCSLAQRRIRFSVLELTRTDPRKPILFLRPFKDDRVKLGQARVNWGARIGKWLDHISDIDRMLLDEGTPYGPVVAIGKPGDELPPYAVARHCFDNRTWQSAVLELAKTSMAVILCVSESEGIWWEVEHVATRYPGKTLILVHPSYRAEQDNVQLIDKIATIMERAVPTFKVSADNARQSAGKQPALLGFYTDGEGALNIARSSTFSRVAFLIVVRFFLRRKWGLAGVSAAKR